MSPRTDLATALDAAAPAAVSVFAEEPVTAPALPAFVLRPGSPYREAGQIPGCLERWRLEVVALVPIDEAKALDALDLLIDTARDVIQAMPWADYSGVRSSPTVVTMGGKPMRGAVIETIVEVAEA